MPLMPETRSHAWQQAGLAAQIAKRDARRARREVLVLIPLIAGVLVAYSYREQLLPGVPAVAIRIGTFALLVILGWAFARSVGRALGPALFRRLDPATAGTVGFLIRLATIGVALLVALRVAGLKPEALVVGGAVTAVVVGLAAQQTFGNVFAGLVLLSAQPFRVGDRVRLAGGGVGGEGLEGVVSSLGLLYTTFLRGGETVMVPNSVILTLSITPVREPASVDLRVRLRAGVKPSDLQELLAESVDVATRSEPRIVVEEVDGDEVVVRVVATPQSDGDGAKLADEIITSLAKVTNGDSRPAQPTPATPSGTSEPRA